MAIVNFGGGTPPPTEKAVDAKSEGGQGEDVIGNLKAEMNRKLSNTEAKIDELSRVSMMLAEQLRVANQPKVKEETRKLSELAIEDPDAYAAVIEERASKAAERRVQEAQMKTQKQNEIFSNIIAEYPEAADPSHDLVKRATELFSGLSDEDKRDPMAYKTVMYQAASEAGIKPKSKRKDSDEPQLGGRGSTQRNPKAQQAQLDQATIDFARAMGRPVDDPKYIEKLSKIASRNFGRYE